MRTPTLSIHVICLAAAAVLAGCDKPKAGSGSAENSQPAMPQTQGALSTAAEETKKAVSAAAATVKESAKTTASDITSKFLAMAKTQGDNILSSIGQDLGTKAKALMDSCGPNPAVKTNIESSLTSLLNGKDNEALAPTFQVAQGGGLGLTAPQLELAKEVGNLASAFVVQRNFSSLTGAQGDVAKLVNSLKEGQYAATLSPLKNIMNNASLTPDQKQLIGSIAEKYAPALKGAASTLQQGLQSLPSLPGIKK